MTKDEINLVLDAVLIGFKAERFMTDADYALQDKAVLVLQEALAEQPAQQEPVTWGVDWGQAGQIPCVSIIKRLPGGGIEVVAVEYAPYEYNPPAQRTWVSLTDEEIAKLDLSAVTVKDATSDVRAIEAKLKEKNT